MTQIDARWLEEYSCREISRWTLLPPFIVAGWISASQGFDARRLRRHSRNVACFFDLVECFWLMFYLRRSQPFKTLRKHREQARLAGSWTRTSLPSFLHDDGELARFFDGVDRSITSVAVAAANELRPHIDFDEQLLPSRLRPNLPSAVVFDPRVCVGSPTIAGTRLSTEIVVDNYLAEGKDALRVAETYGTTPAAVLTAVAFEGKGNE